MNTKQKIKVSLISLGCDKNRVDSEKILSNLIGDDFELSSESQAEVIIINTCAFIESARKEAIDTILSCIPYKDGVCKKIVVTGCLSQKYRDELIAELPEVDAFLGIYEYENINQTILSLFDKDNHNNTNHNNTNQINTNQNDIDRQNDSNQTINNQNSAKNNQNPVQNSQNFGQNKSPRVISTPFSYAYLKIADGCNNKCTYCTIPSIRGNYRSETIQNLVAEAKFLADNGVKEVVLVAQDVTNYGVDIYQKRSLVDLIRAISATQIEKIRLLYCYPERIDDQLIDEIATNDKVIKYLDMPLQHIDNRILRLMNRKGTAEQIKSLIGRLREKIPQIALRTTFIVGFPSETDDEFANLLQFVREFKFNNVGAFVYSLETDTPSAKIKPKVSGRVAKNRYQQLLLAQQENVAEFNKSAIGKTFKVLYEGIDYERSMFFGRAYFNAPEVDSIVYFSADFVDFGNFYDVEITDFDGYDLIGKKV